MAVWTDWLLSGADDASDKSTVTSGPIGPVAVGKLIEWDMHSRQGVHLLPHAFDVQTSQQMRFHVSFQPADGNISFHFDMK